MSRVSCYKDEGENEWMEKKERDRTGENPKSH